MPPPSLGLELGFGFAVTAFIGAIAWQGIQWHTDPAWLIYWCLCLCGLYLMPRYANAGLLVFLLVGYGISSHGPQYDISLSLRLRDGVAAFCLLAWLFGPIRSVHSHHPWQSKTGWAALALFGWLMISALVAMAQGTPWGPVLRLDPSTYIQAAALFALSASLMQERQQVRLLCWAACAAIFGRAWIQGFDGVYLESYVASLLVMGLPLAGLGAILATRGWERWLFVATGAGMLIYFALAQNRNAGVAALVMAAALAYQSLGRLQSKGWRHAVLLSVAALVLLLVVVPSDYLDRFRVLWDDSLRHATAGLDRSTVNSRLGLWRAALEMASDHPLLGVGPGNYAHFLQFYSPGAGHGGAHNSYLQMLAETGYPGLALYLLFFACVLRVQSLTRARMTGQWQAQAAWMLQLSLIAHLTLGLFNNRNDLVLAYILAGSSLAIYASTCSTRRRSAPRHT